MLPHIHVETFEKFLSSSPSSSVFHGIPSYHRGSSSVHSDLVLDVPQGTAVIFRKKVGMIWYHTLNVTRLLRMRIAHNNEKFSYNRV